MSEQKGEAGVERTTPIRIATSHKTFLGREADLIRNIDGVAEAAEIDGDELGYLLGRVAKVKRIE